MSLEHPDTNHTVLTSQLEAGWLPVVTHVTEIVHLLSLDVRSQETIVSIVNSTKGQTKIPMQHVSFSTTKKIIKPMLLQTQTHSINTVIKPNLNTPLNPEHYKPALIVRNEV